MAEFRVAGGLMVDIASGAEVRDGTDRLVDAITGTAEKKPIYQTRFAAAVTPGAGATTTILRLGRPPTGRVWNLVYLTLTGADDRTAVAGALAASYVGNPDAPSLHGLIDPGRAVPTSQNYGPEEIWIHDGEELFVIVYAAPINTQLSGVARVLEYPAEAREGRGA